MIKRIIKQSFGYLGFEIQKIKTPISVTKDSLFTMSSALKRCLDKGLDVQTAIDIGASDGRWTRCCMDFLSNANSLLMEAQEGHRKSLENFKNEFNNVDYILAAAGSKEGKIFFDDSDLFGGVASENPVKDGTVVPVVSLDKQVTEKNLLAPYLLKLDTMDLKCQY